MATRGGQVGMAGGAGGHGRRRGRWAWQKEGQVGMAEGRAGGHGRRKGSIKGCKIIHTCDIIPHL